MVPDSSHTAEEDCRDRRRSRRHFALYLEALDKNGEGYLWEHRPSARGSVFARPGRRCSWRPLFRSLVIYRGFEHTAPSPSCLSFPGEIDLSIHDSLHSERNVCFELSRAWMAISSNGALVVDAVDANSGPSLRLLPTNNS